MIETRPERKCVAPLLRNINLRCLC